MTLATIFTAERREAWALLMLRLGLGWFLFVWAVNKFLAPQQTVAIWGYFHGIEIAAQAPYWLGAGQVALALAIMLGLMRRASYALGFATHAVTVFVIIEQLVTPFVIEDGYPAHRNNSVALAVLGGFWALYLLRARDAFSLDAWIARHRGAS